MPRPLMIKQPNGCWEWTRLDSQGYGYVKVGNERFKAHRVMWEKLVGPPPEVLHHRCCNRACVNPAHLEPTNRVDHPDAAIALKRAKTHCPQGHPYDEANTLMYQGRRYCRACRRMHSRNYMRRKRATTKASV